MCCRIQIRSLPVRLCHAILTCLERSGSRACASRRGWSRGSPGSASALPCALDAMDLRGSRRVPCRHGTPGNPFLPLGSAPARPSRLVYPGYRLPLGGAPMSPCAALARSMSCLLLCCRESWQCDPVSLWASSLPVRMSCGHVRVCLDFFGCFGGLVAFCGVFSRPLCA